MNSETSKISHYDYDLPKNFIAQHPTAKRDESRLLVLYRKDSRIEHKKFYDIDEFLNCGDVLVLNDTKVIPAKIIGFKTTGGKVEALIIKEVEDGIWEMLLKSNSKLKENESLHFENHDVAEGHAGGRIRDISTFGVTRSDLRLASASLPEVQHDLKQSTIDRLPYSVEGKIVRRNERGSWIVEFKNGEEFKEVLKTTGNMPLPPYIKRNLKNNELEILDEERYQTVYAKKTGAIAAPTAGLHFTESLLRKISSKGVKIAYITLHVGLGTFNPIKDEDFKLHTMHKEYYTVPEDTVNIIKKANSLGKKVIATGTTTCRTLETIARDGEIKESAGWTDIFIYPPYKFKLTDSLITNFHLQRTSLILLVSAFAGRENIIKSYETAIKHGYRFYSYGDCMLIM